MESVIKKIIGILLLCIFFLSIFFCIFMPIELSKVIKSRTWEARDLEILSSRVIRTRRTGKNSGYHFSVEIKAKDLANDKSIKISDVRYGDIPFTSSFFGKILSSGLENDVKKYPAGAKVVGYKDPDSNKYILEKGSMALPVILISFSALWLLGNVFIMIRYPKSRKKQDVSDTLLN